MSASRDSRASKGRAFENACAADLRACGWTANVIGGCGDQGADIVAEKRGTTAVFQCKDWAAPAGTDAVQQALSGQMSRKARFGAVISRSGYTALAVRLADLLAIHLLDKAAIFGLDARFSVRSFIPTRPAKPIDFTMPLPRCPGCDTRLRLPLGRLGYVVCPRCSTRFWTGT
jgi:hypothetical protein